MLCNDLVMPILLRLPWLRLDRARRPHAPRSSRSAAASIALVLFLGYLYFHFIGGSYALVSIGLLSFAAVAQFAPAIIGGIYWKGATRAGALGRAVGRLPVWTYTLLLPSFARSGWLPMDLLDAGPWGMALLRPYALFGLEGLRRLSHALFWSMVANIGLYVGVSLVTRQSPTERIQATRFVEVFQQRPRATARRSWRGTAPVRGPSCAGRALHRQASAPTRASPTYAPRAASPSRRSAAPTPSSCTSPSACLPARSAPPRRA